MWYENVVTRTQRNVEEREAAVVRGESREVEREEVRVADALLLDLDLNLDL